MSDWPPAKRVKFSSWWSDDPGGPGEGSSDSEVGQSFSGNKVGKNFSAPASSSFPVAARSLVAPRSGPTKNVIALSSDSEDDISVVQSSTSSGTSGGSIQQDDEALARRLQDRENRRRRGTATGGGSSSAELVVLDDDDSPPRQGAGPVSGAAPPSNDAVLARRLQQEENRARADEALARRLHLRDQAETDASVAKQVLSRDHAEAERRRVSNAQQRAADEHVARRVREDEERQHAKLRAELDEKRHGSVRNLAELTECQRAALNHVKAKASALHAQAIEPLKQRVLRLGHSEADLNQLLAYVAEDAPIIIHLTQKTLGLLLKDSEKLYRSQFETGTSSGSLLNAGGRTQWEATIFGGHYNNAQPWERCKYGCLNMTGDVCGVAKATHYGTLFMVLKPDNRMRATFTDSDSSLSDGNDVATGEFYAHVFQRYTDVELQAVLRIAQSSFSRIRGASSSSFALYKECQIHGPVSIRKDVSALSVPGRESDAAVDLLRTIEEFQKLSGCNIMWQGELLA